MVGHAGVLALLFDGVGNRKRAIALERHRNSRVQKLRRLAPQS
jgi:hypothetical protein